MNEKQEKYKLLLDQTAAIMAEEYNEISILANVSSLLHETFSPRFLWTGFYLVCENELQLGPFQGSVACMHIDKGKGVCGVSWQKGELVNVPDVHKFSGHIACSIHSRSEIVVPVFREKGEVCGVLDIDSSQLNAFDSVDEHCLSEIASLLSRKLADINAIKKTK